MPVCCQLKLDELENAKGLQLSILKLDLVLFLLPETTVAGLTRGCIEQSFEFDFM